MYKQLSQVANFIRTEDNPDETIDDAFLSDLTYIW